MVGNPEDIYLLNEYELYWRDHFDWLQQSGYALRPRYKPNWVPSWQGTKRRPGDFEDSRDCEVPVLTSAQWCSILTSVQRPVVLDATRVSDKEMVLLKRIHKSIHPYEVGIGQYFSSEALASDPRNHCCPVYDVLHDPADENTAIIVMPLLRRYNDPNFLTVGEALEFFRQIFEALAFMHEHHVAHRDCMTLNIMMDARPMYPEMYHPRSPFMKRDYSGKAKHYSRTRRPVKYYLTDFGISKRFDKDDTKPIVVPIISGDPSAPEFQEDKVTARNPFPTDVYYLGNVIREDFLTVSRPDLYSNLKFLYSLVGSMVRKDPATRPTMAQVVKSFEQLVSKLSKWQLGARLVLHTDDSIVNALKYVHHLYFRLIPYLLLRLPSLPSPKS
ncbi:kinase-like domain-containing protein [Dichomitus squalens]|uniref:non-specific serine/threonine protein kinase n=1 Tax=Dichomitus squalens TaxID=114155 RepID=A0A4Q9NTZ2_9APHY|nr:kinase-like domain-containing protein [Dichomitus squalens]TBU64356.1 kinase-like domain-containing protein [Dichomitus squalens]